MFAIAVLALVLVVYCLNRIFAVVGVPCRHMHLCSILSILYVELFHFLNAVGFSVYSGHFCTPLMLMMMSLMMMYPIDG